MHNFTEDPSDSAAPEATDAPGVALQYQPSTVGLDSWRYDVSSPGRGFQADPVATATLDDLAPLAASPHWEDRVRAEVLRQHTRITLPDQFPCIYETADSRNGAGVLNARPFAWVVSPDIEMLTELLPDYQELWDSYTAQWGPSSRRTMAVGRLDGLRPHSVYRPGTTPEQVIGATMLTHSDMYRYAPHRLRRMHPQHAAWHPEDAATV